MDAEYSAEQEALRSSVRALLATHATRPSVRTWCQGGDPVLPDAVWRALAGIGVPGLLVPTACGGSGGTMTDLGVVLEEHGRALLPGPLVDSAVGAASALASADAWAADRLADIASGDLTAAVATGPGLTAERSTDAAVRDGAAWRLHGRITHVTEGATAGLLVLAAVDDLGDPALYAVDRRGDPLGIGAQPVQLLDITRRAAHLTVVDLPARRLAVDVRQVADRVALAWVLDALGAAAALLELTVAYAHDRHQFGAPIGSFQAVQHLCADMLRGVEVTRAAAYHALWAVDAAARGELEPDEARRAVVVARAAAVESLPAVGADAIQVHGGIGFTWEHDAHLFHKRILTMAALVSTPTHPLDDLATLLL